MARLPDHYAALGVRPDADAAEIRRAWIRAARANHPDRRGEVTEAQTERSDRRMRAVNEAWRVLGRVESRRLYDEERAAAAPQSPPPAPAARPAGSGGPAAQPGAPGDHDFDEDFGTTSEPGGPGGFVVRHRSAALMIRVLPWATIAVVGMVIFVASAYMSADPDAEPSNVAALEVGECFWEAPNGTLRTVDCDWPQNDGVLDQIITTSASDRCRHPDAVAHPAPIAGRRLCLVPVDRWEPPAAE
ncbi:J domain-containing protein [Candidatus Poriferisodalis sp.]|uniref:J domain-containing protein n=1 Tax=Candidatus Poriferisodalis sp. TaxID=3101277 RepID=UPI003B02E2B3